MESDADYVIGADGRITFTPAGRAFYTAYFGYAGIDIRRIETAEDFEAAGRRAFPFLFAFMAERLQKGPQTPRPAHAAGHRRRRRERASSGSTGSSPPARGSRVIPGSRGGHPAPH